MTSRLPTPGSDDGQWGTILNDYLSQSHNTDGSLKPIDQSTITGLTSALASKANTTDLATKVDATALTTALATKANVSDLAAKANTSDLATVATTGSYTDLTNKPSLATVATSGSYADLSNKPDISSSGLYGANVVFDGDSITTGGISTNNGNQDRNGSWTQQLAALSQGRINYLYNAGSAGQTSAGMLSRFDAYVAPQSPDTVIATIGTNDIGQSLTQASWLANIAAYKAKCDAIGARLQLGEIWPTDSSSLGAGVRGATGRSWNQALRTWCQQNGLCPPIPWTLLADPSTGGWSTAWNSSGDHIHPSGGAMAAIGMLGWQYLSPMFGSSPLNRPSMNNGDSAANGFMLTSSGGTSAPPSVSAVASTSSGTLAAGTYSYKMTAQGYFGESDASSAVSATLSAAGNVAVAQAAGSPPGNQGFAVYRLDPASGTYRYLATVASGTYTYTDDGTAALGSATPPTTNRSVLPAGWLAGGGQPFQPGKGLLAAESTFARGNKRRLTPSANTANTVTADSVTLISSGVAVGQVYEGTVLVQGDGNLQPNFKYRFFDSTHSTQPAAPVVTASDIVLAGQVYLYVVKFTIPSTSTAVAQIAFSAETTGTSGWLDVAEFGLRRVS